MARPDRIQHVEGPPRVVTSWSPGAVRLALTQLQRGDFSTAGALADAVLGDDRVQAVLGTRVNGLLGLPLEFEAVDESDRAIELANVLEEDWWAFAPEPTLREWLSYALLVGACAAELVWDVTGQRALPRLKVWHPSTLRRSDAGQWSVRLANGKDLPITPGDGKWALLAPYGERRAGTHALVRALALPWLSKNFAVSDWNRYSEVHGNPTKVGRHPGGATKEEKDAFLSDMRAMASSAAVVVPDGWNVELLEAKVGSGEVFAKLIEWANKAMSVAVLGQNLTTDVEGGSHAAAQVHENVRQDLIDSDAETLSTTAREQVLVWWAEFNFAARDLAPWPDWDSSPPADEAQTAAAWSTRAQALQTLATVQAQVPLPIDWKQVAGELRVPLRDGADVPEGPATLPVEEEDGENERVASVRLASGDEPGSAMGFVRGQLVADDLADVTAGRGSEAVRPAIERVTELVMNASSYEELRRLLLSEYARLDVDELAQLTESAVTLAILAGRWAVREDT